jgi:uncharacterized protein YfaS (alpha-2-macroglobulin family)
MTCEEVRSKFSWYVDGELAEAEAEAVREHARACESCGARLAEMREVDDEIRGALLRGPSAGFARRVASAVRPRRSAWPLRLGIAAGILFALLGGTSIYVNSMEAPPLQVVLHGGESFHADSIAALRLFVSNASLGSPVAGAAVRVMLAGKEVGKFTTGAAGTIEGFFRVPDVKDGSYVLQVEVDSPIGKDVLAKAVGVRRETKLHLTTDKPMYQPGQTIHLRALALDAFTLKPRAGAAAQFEILDSKGNRVLSKNATLSEFGIASTDLELADEINLGTYKAIISASGLRQERTVEVAKYVLPKFEVKVDLEKASYRPREVIRGTVRAKYFFGKPVHGRAKVAIGAETVSGDLRDDGTWEFQAPAPGDGLAKVEATVTDTADHRETKATGVIVAAEPLQVTLYPEGGQTVAGVENTYYVLVTTADGRPAKASVALFVNGEKQDLETDELGVAKVTAKPPYRILLDRARDRSGNETRTMKAVGADESTDFTIRLDKAAYKGGETMTVRVIGANGEPVYVDFVKGGQLLLAKVVEKGEVAFDLPADLFGTVQVVAYKRSTARAVSRVAYVNLPEGLKIRPKISKETFRPGEEMPVEFEVVDKDGKPIQAALGISVVDEALFALVESKIASEQAWFALAPELIDTRGFLKAEAEAIYGSSAENAKRFVSGNLRAQRPEMIARNAWIERRHKVENLIERYNEAMITVLKVAAVLLALALGSWFIVVMFKAAAKHGFVAGLLLGGVLVAIILVLLAGAAVQRSASVSLLEGIGTAPSSAPKPAMRMLPDEVPSPAVEAVPEPPKPEPKLLDTKPTPSKSEPAEPVRVREYFPETLYWNPQLITDEKGRAKLTLPAADSITSWRMLASAVSRGGVLGFEKANLRVFQDFFVDIDFPVALTKGDRVHVPVAVYNYLKEPQTVTVRVEKEPWFELLDSAEKQVTLKAEEVGVVYFGMKVTGFGRKTLTVYADGKMKDAIKRSVEIMEKGREVPITASERIVGRHTFKVTIPENAIEGATALFARITPGGGDLVTGLQGMIQMPYG